MLDLPEFQAYRKTELPWLKSIPAHWELKRAKAFLTCIDERSESGLEEILTVSSIRGVVPRRTANVTMFKAASYKGHKLCWPGDLVVNSLWAWAGGLGVSRHHGIISTAYSVYRPSAGLSPAYLHELVRSTPFQWEFQLRSKGVWISRLQLTDSSFLDAPIPVPPLEEQEAIVRFLDWANGRLERVIRGKRKVIALLTEQKQAIIHRAVTRGLDPTVPLKPSGIPWLGDIPAHWDTKRVKQTAEILRGKFSHRPRNDAALYDGPFPFIQTGSVARSGGVISNFKQSLNERGLAVSKLFPAGTLVMTIAANIGEVAVLTFDACFPDSIVGFRPYPAIERNYLQLVFGAMKPELLREAPVNTQGNLNVERIGCMVLPCPPIEEQRLLCESVALDVTRFDSAISRLKSEIALLSEYRTRLTADVVTGKLDVRETAKNLPAEPEFDLADEANDLDDETDDEETAE